MFCVKMISRIYYFTNNIGKQELTQPNNCSHSAIGFHEELII